MRIIRIEIEADSNDLKASNTLSEGFGNMLRRALNPMPELYDPEDEEEDGDQ